MNVFRDRLLELVSERLTSTEALAHLARMSPDEVAILVQREGAAPLLSLPDPYRGAGDGLIPNAPGHLVADALEAVGLLADEVREGRVDPFQAEDQAAELIGIAWSCVAGSDR